MFFYYDHSSGNSAAICRNLAFWGEFFGEKLDKRGLDLLTLQEIGSVRPLAGAGVARI